MHNNSNSFSAGRQGKEKRFSIHDAFEEETDEAIRVYGSTVISTPMRSKQRSTDDVSIRIQDPKGYNKYNEDTTSRDSDSLIQEYGNISTDEVSTYCWRHPKVRENWRTVLAAVTLLLVGTGLFVMGTFAVADPANTSQGVVFFVAGLICFIPGAYHVVYIWLAAKGYRGFDFYHLPLFT
ncbi:transmembrane protein 134 [Glossina fuscipes]|uniref:Transmembrane protein 134 n=2 Tax=Glossina TaxID=7393 RepID=A0A9C5ZPC3_9MUSC|nr:transmembrane protein 134 [Glossina fuscipes]